MNLCGSLPNHENRIGYDGTPLQGSPRHGGQGFFLNSLFQIHSWDDRLRAVAIIVHGGV